MRIRRKKTYNPTMIELIIGILFLGVIGLVLVLGLHFASVPLEKWFDDSIWQIILGYIFGIIFSVATIFHMTSSVEEALMQKNILWAKVLKLSQRAMIPRTLLWTAIM